MAALLGVLLIAAAVQRTEAAEPDAPSITQLVAGQPVTPEFTPATAIVLGQSEVIEVMSVLSFPIPSQAAVASQLAEAVFRSTPIDAHVLSNLMYVNPVPANRLDRISSLNRGVFRKPPGNGTRS